MGKDIHVEITKFILLCYVALSLFLCMVQLNPGVGLPTKIS